MNTNFDDICIMVPCYNAGRFLRQALDSAMAQTHRAKAVIVVDDGSTDDSAAIAGEYAQSCPRANMHLIRQANQGEVGARNTGIRAAAEIGCTWVAMLDADDWWEPQKLQLQLQAARDAGPECVMVHTGAVVELPDGRSENGDLATPAKRTGWCLQAMLEPGSIGHPSIMVRLDALQRIGGYDPDFPHACDVNLYYHLLTVGTFAFVPQRLLHYRIHSGQTSFNYKLDQIRYQCRVVTDFFAAHPELEAKIGRAKIDAELARFIVLKLESLYWRRRLADFRALLAFASEKNITDDAIARWRHKARWPDWMILLKDKIVRR